MRLKFPKLKLNKKLIITILLFIITTFIYTIAVNSAVDSKTKSRLYSNVNEIPTNKVGLLLGTSKYLPDGRLNLYYQYRLSAAVKLYRRHKIKYILISGDNGSIHYDEPTTFKNDLIESGIPNDRIYLDYAGFRTLDSVIRSNKIFGQDSITVISQPFHNSRAVYLASHYNISAVGYNAKDVSKYYGFKTRFREMLARVKMMQDIIWKKKPKFLGKEIIIGIPQDEQ